MLVFDSIAPRLRTVMPLAYLGAKTPAAPVGDSHIAGKLNGVIR